MKEWFSEPFCVTTGGAQLDISGYDDIWNNNTCIINNNHAYNFNFIGTEINPRLVLLVFNNLSK